MRITSKGQVTIPQAVREAAGLLPGTDVDFIIHGEEVRVIKASETNRIRFRQAAARARARGHVQVDTDEFMRLVRDEWPYQGP